MNRLQERYQKLFAETDTRFHRYMYDRVDWGARMIGLTGPRGVGKTTLVLQHIKEKQPRDTSLYVTAEDFYFADHRLLDLADDFVKQGAVSPEGIRLYAMRDIAARNFRPLPTTAAG